jgi:DNA-binding transcriptional regulator YiaG
MGGITIAKSENDVIIKNMAEKTKRKRERIVDLTNATPAQRLKYVRQLARLSRPYLEEKHQLPEATLKVWENSQSRITPKGLNRCIDIYRKEGVVLSKEWVMTGEGLSPQLSVGIGNYLASDLHYPFPEQRLRDADDAFFPKDDNICMLREASFFKESYADTVVLIVADNDMWPTYQAGDYVGGCFRRGKAVTEALQRDCIVRLKNGEKILRRLFKSKRNKCYNLMCVNPMPEAEQPIMFNVEIECAAPVIWHRKPNK